HKAGHADNVIHLDGDCSHAFRYRCHEPGARVLRGQFGFEYRLVSIHRHNNASADYFSWVLEGALKSGGFRPWGYAQVGLRQLDAETYFLPDNDNFRRLFRRLQFVTEQPVRQKSNDHTER